MLRLRLRKNIEKKYNIKIFLLCLNVLVVVVVVVVLHGQNCVVNENCLYKAILKTTNQKPEDNLGREEIVNLLLFMYCIFKYKRMIL